MKGEPIRILHVFGRMDRGGAETRTMELYRNTDRSKVQFDFMVHTAKKCAYDDEINRLGGKIYRVPSYKGINHLKYKKEWTDFFINNKKHKFIHGHMTSTAAVYLKTAKKFGIKTIAHARSTSSGDGFIGFAKDLMRYPIKYTADYLFACSKSAGLWLYGKKHCRYSNFRVINNAIDSEPFIYNEKIRQKIRGEFNIADKFAVCHAGRFIKVKNHTFLIDIFAEIHKRNSNAVLLLAGDGELRGDIESKIAKSGLKDSVILTGVRSDIPDLFRAADVFLLPSLYEGLPGVLIEAQAGGLHCIASDSITEEAKITDLAEYISLKKPVHQYVQTGNRP